MDALIDLRVTCEAVPLEIEGTVFGRPIYFRARSTRWELYEGLRENITGADAEDHLAGDGITRLGGGEWEEDQDEDTALALTLIVTTILATR